MPRSDFDAFWKRLKREFETNGQSIGDKRVVNIEKWLKPEPDDDWSGIIARWSELGSLQGQFKIEFTGDNVISEGQVLRIRERGESTLPMNLPKEDFRNIYQDWEDHRSCSNGIAIWNDLNSAPWVISILKQYEHLM